MNLPPEVKYSPKQIEVMPSFELKELVAKLYLLLDKEQHQHSHTKIALSDERDRFDTASKELDRVHKEARDARDDAKIAWAAVRIANEDKRELNAELERLRGEG